MVTTCPLRSPIRVSLISAIASYDRYRLGSVTRSFAAIASRRPVNASNGMNCLARLDLGMGALTVFVATLMKSLLS